MHEWIISVVHSSWDSTSGAIPGHIPFSLRRFDWDSSPWADGQYWLLASWENHLLHWGIFLTLMRWIVLCLVFMIPYSTQGINISMISYCFRSQFTSWFKHILQLFHDLWYCGWLHMTLFEIEMDHIRFHPKSIDGLPNQEFMRRYIFAIVVFQLNNYVHLLSFMFEISWQGIYLRYKEIYVYTSWDLYHDVLFLSHYDICSCLFHLTF